VNPPEKDKGGRPILGLQAKRRYQVMLEPATAEKLRVAGGDNLSAGIALAAKKLRIPHFG
jgi:hypothetical protein